MLRVTYCDAQRVLLVDGHRDDYARFREAVRRVLASVAEIVLPVQSAGRTEVTQLVVRRGPPPTRVSCDPGRIVLSVAPSLQEQFLSFIEFPADADLPDSPIQYHHHFDYVGDDRYVAPDSLPVVFGLERV
jgi:hypothetical protein